VIGGSVQVQSEFKPKYGTKAKTAAAHAFDRQFGSRLKYHMEYCINNPGEISKIHRVKAKVDEVNGSEHREGTPSLVFFAVKGKGSASDA
jgi:hypothetical protein